MLLMFVLSDVIINLESNSNCLSPIISRAIQPKFVCLSILFIHSSKICNTGIVVTNKASPLTLI